MEPWRFKTGRRGGAEPYIQKGLRDGPLPMNPIRTCAGKGEVIPQNSLFAHIPVCAACIRLYMLLKADRSRWIEPVGELAIGIIAQFGGDDGPLSGEEQELVVRIECADLVWGEQGAPDMLLAEADAGGFCVEGAAHRFEHDCFLPEQVGDKLRALLIVDAEHLQDAGVGQEGAGALAVEGA